jgi:hypothetical protein
MPRDSVTLKEVLNRLDRTNRKIELFRANGEFEAVYNRRLDNLADAMWAEAQERKLPAVDRLFLPEATKFTTRRVVVAFGRLCQWLDSTGQKSTPEAET